MDTKKVTIEQLKEGFLVTDQDDERYAVVSLLPWLGEYFDISEPEHPKPELMVPLRPEDLKIAPFDFNKENMQKYQTLFFQDLPDGRTVLKYINSYYYTSKLCVMDLQIDEI